MSPVSTPAQAPNFNSPEPLSAWWSWLSGADGMTHYTGTVGRQFVYQLKAVLGTEVAFRQRQAYRRDGPLGAPNTEFGTLSVDAKWDAALNAALWRAVAERAKPDLDTALWTPTADMFDAPTLRILDLIEECARTRVITADPLRAGVYFADPHMYLAGTTWADFLTPGVVNLPRTGLVPPPWDAQPPVPRVPGRAWWSWRDGDRVPTASASSVGEPGSTPTDGGASGPQIVGPTSNTRAGARTDWALIAAVTAGSVGVVAALGVLGYQMLQRRRRELEGALFEGMPPALGEGRPR